MEQRLYDSELRVMEVLWSEGDKTAKQLAAILLKQVGWSKTTTYTVIKKCLEKNAVSRSEPGFLCHALLTKEEVQKAETAELIHKMYDGSADLLIASLLGREHMTPAEIERLRRLVARMAQEDK